MIISRFSQYLIRTTKIRPNRLEFLDLLRAPTGSHIPITPEQKQKINQQIDSKMQQLQDTGLSREQILLSKSQKGLPLAIDPFFQYLKNNKIAREVYLKKTDRFSVEKVIDIALRQDIGPDPSYSRARMPGRINEKGRAQLMKNLPERQYSSFNPASYNANEQTENQILFDQLKPHQPLRHIFRPTTRYEKIKTHQKKLKKYDIHWRNIELLRQFLTPTGNLRSRLANCLSSPDQRRVQKAIKTSRNNAGIPHYGRILPQNQRNITNIEDQVKEIGLQNINLETGQIYFSRTRSMDSIEVEKDTKNDLDWRYEQLIQGKRYTLWENEQKISQDSEERQAEEYARQLKEMENKEKGKDKSKMKLDIRKFSIKSLGLHDLEKNRISKDDSHEVKQSFQKRKEALQKKLDSNPFIFSDIIMEEKTL